MNERDILRELSRYWNRHIATQVRVNSCVLAARLSTLALSHFGVDSSVHHVDAVAMNTLWYKMYLEQGVPPSKLPPEAWAVGAVTGENATATHKVDLTGGFMGHVIVTTRDYLIDITANQFDRPEKAIITGAPLIVPQEHIKQTEHGFDIPVFQGVYILRPAERTLKSYKVSVDWQTNYKKHINGLISHIEEKVAESA